MIVNTSESQALREINQWPQPQKTQLLRLTQQYGPPQEICHDTITWHYCQPWKRTVVYRHTVPHNAPHPYAHQDFQAQTIDYYVAPEMFCQLAAFDGSLYPDRTAGELTAKCHMEEANYMAINVAHDMITRGMTPEQAGEHAAQLIGDMVHRKIKSPYLTKFLFAPQHHTADPG